MEMSTTNRLFSGPDCSARVRAGSRFSSTRIGILLSPLRLGPCQGGQDPAGGQNEAPHRRPNGGAEDGQICSGLGKFNAPKPGKRPH